MRAIAVVGCLVCLLVLVGPARAHLPRPNTAANQVSHGSSVLLWLHAHQRPGTKRSRNRVRNAHLWLVWNGLQRFGFAWRDRHGLDPRSPAGCLHRHEASWRNAGHHFGGMQMDESFMRSYGLDFELAFHGYANRWPIWAQLVASYRAWRVRGYSPWPTRSYCNL